jgi:hypothetical protein
MLLSTLYFPFFLFLPKPMQPLLSHISSLSSYQQLLTQLNAGKSAAGLGLPRSARLPVLASLHTDLNQPILLITDRADHALALFDELGFWTKSPRLFVCGTESTFL